MRETPFSFNLIYWILSDVTAVDLLVILGIDVWYTKHAVINNFHLLEIEITDLTTFRFMGASSSFGDDHKLSNFLLALSNELISIGNDVN